MKDITRDIPIIPTQPGADITVTMPTMPIINLLSKENTGLISPAGVSITNDLSMKVIGMEGIDLKESESDIYMGSQLLTLGQERD